MTFEIRNPSYSIKNIRSLYAVRKVMKQWKIDNPRCAWCGRTKIHVHHILPVKDCIRMNRPDLVMDKENLISLCGKRCHIAIGHMGNWKDHNENVVDTCESGKLKKAK